MQGNNENGPFPPTHSSVLLKKSALDHAYALIRQALGTKDGLVIAGICGAQGSGKSTIAAALARRLAEENIRAETLSIDDLYLTRRQRERLAAEVHPLFRTRGVPGTHDVSLGQKIFAALATGQEVPMPRFDKSIDDRTPVEHWPVSAPETRVLIFEGWCVGACPQPKEDLQRSINELERVEDPDGRWRRCVNQALSGEYQRLFAKLDCLLLLAAPDFEVVGNWRIEQERSLRRFSAPSAPGLMSDDVVARFTQHYERLTRHMLREMPARADMTIELAPDRSVRAVHSRT